MKTYVVLPELTLMESCTGRWLVYNQETEEELREFVSRDKEQIEDIAWMLNHARKSRTAPRRRSKIRMRKND